MKLIDKIYFSTKFVGIEHLPSTGSFILASNHVSNLDPFILGTCRWQRFSYVAKNSLFATRFGAMFYPQVGALPIKRDTSDLKAIKEIFKRIKNGCPIILFPEGTRGTGSRTKKPQSGVGLIAVKSGVPVVPVYIKGSDKALPNGAKWFKRHPITITIGKQLTFTKDQPYNDIAQNIMDQVYVLAV